MIAFVHVGKTGGRTINAMLRNSYGAGHCDAVELPRKQGEGESGRFLIDKYAPEDLEIIQDLMPGIRSLGGHNVALWSDFEKVRPDVQYLVFLREPVKRGASHYQYNLQKEDMTPFFGKPQIGWDEWVDWEVHHNHQVKMLSPQVDSDEAIALLEQKNVFVGLLEKFDESLVLFKRLFAPDLNISYRRKNVATQKSIAKGLLQDPRKVEQIREMYAKEFPVYEYALNEIYPRYVREYGAGLDADVAAHLARREKGVNNWRLLQYHIYRKFVFMPRYHKYLRQTASEQHK